MNELRAQTLPAQRLSIVATSTRATPRQDFGAVARRALVTTAGVAENALAAVSPYIPGAPIVSAALAKAKTMAGFATATPQGLTSRETAGAPAELGAGTKGVESSFEQQASFSVWYLQLQQRMQAESRDFNLVSNIMKTRHDAAKNAINNLR